MKNFFLVVLILLSCFVYADVEFTINIENPTMSEQNGLTSVSFENSFQLSKLTEPVLPVYSLELLLDQNEEAYDVEVEKGGKILFAENIKIKPGMPQIPISQPAPAKLEYNFNKDIYNSNERYPKKMSTDVFTNFLSGHSIGSTTICPFEYYPKEGNLYYYQSISVKLKTRASIEANNSQRFLKNTSEIHNRIEKIVQNSQQLQQYTYPQNRTRDEYYDILLISNNALLPYFDEYVEFKQSTGFYVKTISVEEIYSTYTGIDNAEKVRNCIIDYNENFDIFSVIMGGDSDINNAPSGVIVPLRGLSALDDDTIPSDMYFAGLDGNWNNNGNSIYGEQNEWDLYAEVSVGRICVDSPTEVQNFCHKLRMYQDSPVIDDIEKALMLGEELNNAPQTNGGVYKNEIVNGGNYNGYYTDGIANNFDVSTLYQMNVNWDKYDVFDQFNQTGVNLLNHLGHSSPDFNMNMYNSDITTSNFQNDGVNKGYVIGYSQGCYNGSFDNWHYNGYFMNEDCFAEKLTSLETGEVACVANSRYGWYQPAGTNSSSQYYDRLFFHSIFGEQIDQIGNVNRNAKETNVSMIQNDEYMRWTAYETNLFGDPTMSIWTEIPTNFANVNYPTVLPLGSEEISISVGVANARVALVNNGDLLAGGITDENGELSLAFEPLNSPGILEVSVIAQNKNRYIGEIQIIEPVGVYLSLEEYIIDDANGNGLVNNGEMINLDFAITNFGQSLAQNVSVEIQSPNDYISIINANSNYENIGTNEVILNNIPFEIEVSEFCPDNELLAIDLIIQSMDEIFTASVNLNAHAPQLCIDSIQLSESTNNGYLEPGDSAQLAISILNSGSSNAEDITASVYTNDENVNLTNSTANISLLNSGEILFLNSTIDFELSNVIPEISSFRLNILLEDNSGYYALLHTDINVGFMDNIEYGINEWTHSSLNTAQDQWHQSTENFHSDNHSWKIGNTGNGNYEDGLKCALETPEINIGSGNYLSFYHWMEAETSNSYPENCYDGGLVEIYWNNNWEQIFPVGDYPYTTRGDNNPPFPADTPVYSGNINWEEAIFDLDSFSGNVKFRFVFGSDGGTNAEGWYLDDISIISGGSLLFPPENLVALYNINTVELAWQEPQEQPDSYNIYRRINGSSQYEIINTISENSYIDNDLPQAEIIFYAVTAIYDGTESSYSNTVQVQTGTSPAYNYGDVDDNNSVNAFDAAITLQYSVGLDPLPEVDPIPWENWREITADVDGNGNVQSFDSSLILQYAVGLITQFPVEERVVAPFAEIEVRVIDSKLVFIKKGNLLACDIKISEFENISFGDFEVIENDFMLETNITESEYRIGMCRTESNEDETIIAVLPFVIGADALDKIAIDIVANTSETSQNISLLNNNDNDLVFQNKVLGNFPNPFNPETTINFTVKNDNTPVELSIYNVKGQNIISFDKLRFNQGKRSIRWNGKDSQNRNVGSGVYFYKMKIADKISNHKMLLLK